MLRSFFQLHLFYLKNHRCSQPVKRDKGETVTSGKEGGWRGRLDEEGLRDHEEEGRTGERERQAGGHHVNGALTILINHHGEPPKTHNNTNMRKTSLRTHQIGSQPSAKQDRPLSHPTRRQGWRLSQKAPCRTYARALCLSFLAHKESGSVLLGSVNWT